MWRALVAVLLVAGVVCVSVSQTPKPVSSYTLNSWQNQPGKTDQQITSQFTKAISWLVRTSSLRRTATSAY